MKKILLLIILLLLVACTKQTDIDTPKSNDEKVAEPIVEENDEPEAIRYTGEIITDGFWENKGIIYFVPDKKQENC